MKDKICKITMILLVLSAIFQTAKYLQYKRLARIERSMGVYEVLNTEEAAVSIAKTVLEEKFDTHLQTESFSAFLKNTDSEEYKDDYWIITYSDDNESFKVLMRKYNGEIFDIVNKQK